MKNSVFKLHNPFQPAGDQPEAIKQLVKGIEKGLPKQTLLGATGTGKTFTMANVIAQIGKPTLIIAHNKTLAAQLAQEFREFFPENAVHYFVSYYDYYQPEAYMPASDTYIEKDAQINKEIDRLRHATTQSLLTRKDVIIVASVSCIYGLGSPEEYEKVNLRLSVGTKISRTDLIKKLVAIHFTRTNADLEPGTFRSIGNKVEVMPVSETFMYQIILDTKGVSEILVIDPVTSHVREKVEDMFLFPTKHFITQSGEVKRAIKDIQKELTVQLAHFEKEGKLLEAERIKRRTNYDLAMIREIGYCNGIENYSRHLSGKKAGDPPETLLSYFPHAAPKGASRGKPHKKGEPLGARSLGEVPGFITFIDESHVTLPQLEGMYAGDASRKNTLVEFGFRLPSAKDNRPLKYPEFQERVREVVYVSATPSEKERTTSDQIVQQIIRPTGLIDPEVNIRPITARGDFTGQIQDFIREAEITIKKGDRVLATTLTKKMAEDLATYLKERKIKAEYLHSEIKTIDRIKILTQFRKGEFDVLVGVNLLREGLDLPEVSLIGILDADKEGFLRSETSLIQTIGRAARNAEGRVILYADVLTGSMDRAIKETNRRRDIQLAYNKKHGITPKTIRKNIKDITAEMESEHSKAVNAELTLDIDLFKKVYAKELNKKEKTESKTIDKLLLSDEERELAVYDKIIKIKEKEMNRAVKELDFETAAILRDEIGVLKQRLEKSQEKQKEE